MKNTPGTKLSPPKSKATCPFMTHTIGQSRPTSPASNPNSPRCPPKMQAQLKELGGEIKILLKPEISVVHQRSLRE